MKGWRDLSTLKKNPIKLLTYTIAGAISFGGSFLLFIEMGGSLDYVVLSGSTSPMSFGNPLNLGVACAFIGVFGGGILGILCKDVKKILLGMIGGGIGFGIGGLVGYLAGALFWVFAGGLIMIVMFTPILGYFATAIMIFLAVLFGTISFLITNLIVGAIGGFLLGYLFFKNNSRALIMSTAGGFGFGLLGASLVGALLATGQIIRFIEDPIWLTIIFAIGGASIGAGMYLAEEK